MLTVEENIGFLLREHGQLRPAEIRERVEACLEAVGLYVMTHLYTIEWWHAEVGELRAGPDR